MIIVAVVSFFGASGFREAFLSNFLATLAGVAVGVPVAIWLALEESSSAQRHLATQAAKDARAHRRQVLEVLDRELRENKSTLEARRAGGTREYFVPFLQDEVWGAMSDGGQLQWIEEPALLRQLARAYVYVRTITYLEQQVIQAVNYPGMRVAGPDGKTSVMAIVEGVTAQLDHLDGVAIAAIDEALGPIKVALSANGETTESARSG